MVIRLNNIIEGHRRTVPCQCIVIVQYVNSVQHFVTVDLRKEMPHRTPVIIWN